MKGPVTQEEHLLIDGYNLIHAWPGLHKNQPASNTMALRTTLADRVRNLHDFDGVRTTLVFDGQGDRIEIERPGAAATFSFLFTPSGLTADAVIEQLVAQSHTPQTITVVTEDAMIRETIISLGAFWLSATQFQKRLSHCEQRQDDYLNRNLRS